MKIELRMHVILSRYLPDELKNSPAMEIPENMTVKELLRYLEVPLNAVKAVFINSVQSSKDQILREGDRIDVFPNVAGG